MIVKLALLLALAAAAACDTGTDSSGVPDAAVSVDASAICLEAIEHDDLEWIHQNVFLPQCGSFRTCHTDFMGQPAAGLNLDAERTEAQILADLVGQPCVSDGLDGLGLTRVVAGDAAGSHLMVLIDHVSRGGRLDGLLPDKGTMPVNNPLICIQKRDTIARWIDSLPP